MIKFFLFESSHFLTCPQVIEHVENPEQFIKNCIRSLKPNGSLFVSTMNRTKKSYAMTIVGAEYILRMLPPGWWFTNTFLSCRNIIKIELLQVLMTGANF